MTSDSGLTRQDTDYASAHTRALDELQQMQQTPRLVTSPEELEALEREIRQRTDRLGSLLVGPSPPAGVGFRRPCKPSKTCWCASGPSRSKTMAG